MKNLIKIVAGKVEFYTRTAVDVAETMEIEIVGEPEAIAGATYDEQNNTLINSDGGVIAHVK